MSLSAVYQQFLAAPNPEALASDATFNYVTTLTSFSDSAQIIKHLSTQQKVLRKQSEKVLSAIENDSAVFLEIETTIEFISGGSAYLPGLDDNFLADRIVTLPIVRRPGESQDTRHMLTFCSFMSYTSTLKEGSSKSACTGIKPRF